ncbi:GNAT family N-acetyltransferase [Acetobacteraceae bacterium]|nr:GNAT family N-acetyltransferase [Candidatus Parcubacteria bacterium]
MIILSPEKSIETGKTGVVLRQFAPADAAPLFELIEANWEHLNRGNDVTAQKYPTLECVRVSIETPLNPKKSRWGIWSGSCLVGSVNLTPLSPSDAEIAYWVGEEYCGRGVATVATVALVPHAFRVRGFKTLYASARRENIGSQLVLQRAGFRFRQNFDKSIQFSQNTWIQNL